MLNNSSPKPRREPPDGGGGSPAWEGPSTWGSRLSPLLKLLPWALLLAVVILAYRLPFRPTHEALRLVPATPSLAARASTVAPSAQQQQQQQPRQQAQQRNTTSDTKLIPRIYHILWLGDQSIPEAHARWIDSCRAQLSPRFGWQMRLWNLSAVEAVLEEHRPEFLPMFRGFPKLVQRIDMAKYLLLEVFGGGQAGLYLDTDVECFREPSDTLDGFDMIVQEDYPGAAVNSGVIACMPNHPAWKHAFDLMVERKDHDIQDTGFSTGPQIVRDMLLRWHNVTLNSTGLLPPVLAHPSGRVTRVYKLGTWCTPCGYADNNCHEQFMLQRVVGSVNLTEMVAYHRFTATWLGYRDGVRPQAKDTVRAMFCKECTEELKQCHAQQLTEEAPS